MILPLVEIRARGHLRSESEPSPSLYFQAHFLTSHKAYNPQFPRPSRQSRLAITRDLDFSSAKQPHLFTPVGNDQPSDSDRGFANRIDSAISRISADI